MSQKIKTSVEIDGSLSASQIANATTDTDKFLVSDGGTIKYRTGAELATDLGISAGVTSKVQHQVKAGVAINKGQAVYVTGADGTNMIVGLASNATEATSSKTMGLLNATVSANGFADVITEGLLDGLDTSTAVVGNPVWLGTGGNLIYGLANKPYAPAHLVFIGIVTRVNANNGEIFVKVQNGFELDEIHDIDLKTTTPINGHLLGYNGTLWVNKTIAGWLGYTPQAQLNGTGFVKASGTTITYDNTSYYPASNPNGYISTYTETDTLASVTSRGSITTNPITINSTSLQHLTLNNRFNLVGSSNFHITNNAYYNSGFKYKFAEVASKIALNSDNSFVFQTAPIGVVDATITFENKFWADSAGNALSTGSMRSPIFYDYDNTGYYIDPSSQSNLYTVYANSYNLYNGNTIWNSGNDGSGSGLDADLLDGQQATSFAKQAYVNVGYDFNTLAAENSDSGIVYRLESSVINPPTGGIYNWSLWQQGNSTRGSQIAVGAYGGNEIYFRGANADTGSYRGWQRVLHDGNYSSYAVPTSRTITINGTSYDLSANRSWTVSAAETDTLATVVARGNTANSSIAVRNSISINKSDGSSGGQLAYDSAINQLYLWNSLSSGYFSVYTNNAERLNISSGGAVTANVDMRAPIFYDSNDTGYYVDPASTSNLNVLSMANKIILGSFPNSTTNNGEAWIGRAADRSAGTMTVQLGGNLDRKFEVVDYGWTTVNFSVNGYGAAEASGSMRAPIFYDSNDTTYYLDPASTGTSLNVRGYIRNPSIWINDGDDVNGYNENIRLFNASNGVSVIAFGASGTSGTPQSAILGYSDRYEVRVGAGNQWQQRSYDGYTEIYGSSRAPLFYDSNNTGYYGDFASTSKLNTLILSALASDDGMIENNTGAYFHLGGWGVGRTAATAVLVNTAYRSDYSDSVPWSGVTSKPSYLMYYQGFTLDANTMDTNATGFTYANNAPYNGPVARFSTGGGYDLWLNAPYGSNGFGLAFRTRNGDAGTFNSWQYPAVYGINVNGGGVLYASVYYDQNNTGYYCDPSSTSRMVASNIDTMSSYYGMFNTQDVSVNSTYGVYWQPNASTDYGIYKAAGAWTQPLHINFYTGIRLRAHQSYGGTQFYNVSSGNTVMGVNNGDNNVHVYTALYSPIMYDENNSGYYVDPASTSNINSITIGSASTAYGGISVVRSGGGSDPYGVLAVSCPSGDNYSYIGMTRNGIIGLGMGIDTSNNFWIGGTGGGHNAVRTSTNILINSGGVQSPVFYDLNNTAYYFDGSSTGDSIRVAGDVVAYYSDERLKDKKGNIKNALEKVLSLNGFYYTPNEKAQKLGYKYKEEVGVSAQEVEVVLPEIIKDAPIGHGYKTLDYGKLTPLLIEAIKEQQTQIEELKQLVNKLINK